MTLNLILPEREELTPRITVFGVGGAGGNAVNNMIEKALEGVEFVVANTDAQALAQSHARARVQLGVKVTEGLGAGARANVGAAAAEEAIEEIVDHLAGAHMCFITAGMGGGTGTGAAPIIAQAARELGVLTVGVVTKPFQFEGAKRMRQAEDGVDALQQVVDTLIIIPNQNLFRLANEKTTFTEAFALADDVLYQGVKGVTDLMVRPGLINLDFADVRAVMDEMGKAMMGTGEASGQDRARDAAEKAIANPLLDEISLNGAKGVLINITGGHDLTLFELDEAATLIREKVDPDANIIVGSTLDESLEGIMRVSVVATGIEASAAAADTPVPRRRLSEPLQPGPTLRGEAPLEHPWRESEVAEAAPEEVAPPSAPVAEPRFQPRPAAVEAMSAPEGEDELPPPAYAARQVEPQPGLQAGWMRPTTAAEQAEATARAPGTPSPEALARLRAAVQKAPPGQASGPQTAPRPEPHARQAAADRPRFGINPLSNKMTGAAGEQPPRASAAVRPQPRFRQTGEPTAEHEADRESVEIPAFLRRQAN